MKVIAVVVVLIVLAMGVLSFIPSASAEETNVNQLQALIAKLLAFIEQLKARLALLPQQQTAQVQTNTQCGTCPANSKCQRVYVCASCAVNASGTPIGNCPCSWTYQCVPPLVTPTPSPTSTPSPAPTPTCKCNQSYSPVCGADGKTYSNSCWAACANVVIRYEGICNAQQNSSSYGCRMPCTGQEWPQDFGCWQYTTEAACKGFQTNQLPYRCEWRDITKTCPAYQ